MSSISPEKIQLILNTIDSALEMHSEWYDDLVRMLLCRTPLDESYVAKDAHCKCDFGHWFYTQNDASFHSLPLAEKVGDLHKVMHDSARELALKIKVTGRVQEADYDSYVSNLTLFKEELVTFRQRALDTLKSVTPN